MPLADEPKNSELPAVGHFAVTPSNDTDLDPFPRAIFVGAAGDIAIQDADGVSVTYTVTAGQVIPFRARRVLATGTTATNIVGWY